MLEETNQELNQEEVIAPQACVSDMVPEVAQPSAIREEHVQFVMKMLEVNRDVAIADLVDWEAGRGTIPEDMKQVLEAIVVQHDAKQVIE